MKTETKKQITKFIKNLSPGKTKEELRQAEMNFLRFINLAERIHNRIQDEKEDET